MEIKKEVSEIIEGIRSLPGNGKAEVFKLLFLETINNKDLGLIKWSVDGLCELKEASKKIDKVIDILNNAKRRA